MSFLSAIEKLAGPIIGLAGPMIGLGGPMIGLGGPMIGLGGSLIGGFLGSKASESAANTQAQAAAQANQTQLQMNRENIAAQLAMLNQNRADLAPWRTAGASALSKMSALQGPAGYEINPTNVQLDPGYQFRQAEGLKAIQNNYLSKGMGLSGSALKAAERFNQGLATDEYSRAYNRQYQQKADAYNRLAALSGTGQITAGQIAQMGQNTANQIALGGYNTANNISSNLIGAGNALAAGQIGQANAWNNAINQGLGMYGAYKGWLK